MSRNVMKMLRLCALMQKRNFRNQNVTKCNENVTKCSDFLHLRVSMHKNVLNQNVTRCNENVMQMLRLCLWVAFLEVSE